MWSWKPLNLCYIKAIPQCVLIVLGPWIQTLTLSKEQKQQLWRLLWHLVVRAAWKVVPAVILNPGHGPAPTVSLSHTHTHTHNRGETYHSTASLFSKTVAEWLVKFFNLMAYLQPRDARYSSADIFRFLTVKCMHVCLRLFFNLRIILFQRAVLHDNSEMEDSKFFQIDVSWRWPRAKQATVQLHQTLCK